MRLKLILAWCVGGLASVALTNNAWALICDLTPGCAWAMSGDTNSGPSTSSPVSAAGPNADTFAEARFDASTGTVGVAASSNGASAVNTLISYSNAAASLSDNWAPGPISIGQYLWGFHYHVEGIISAADFNTVDAVSLRYQFSPYMGPVDFVFFAGFDGGSAIEFSATSTFSGTATDITSSIQVGTNATGGTTFLLDYTTPTYAWDPTQALLCPQTPCGVLDYLNATADVEPYQIGSGVNVYSTDFFDTFSVDLIAGNAQSVMTSAGGRTTLFDNGNPGNTVPEPTTIALFGIGLTGFGFARRRKAS